MSDRFQAAGVEAARLQANGMGAANPLAANTTLSGRAKNRRTEITFVVAHDGRSRAVAVGGRSSRQEGTKCQFKLSDNVSRISQVQCQLD